MVGMYRPLRAERPPNEMNRELNGQREGEKKKRETE
jgi:hypothetical protein